MAFAKDYKEEITLAYYCFSLFLTIAALVFGTIYLWHRDRRDQQRREWRQFAERIYSDYSKLKDKGIHRKISKVRDTFQNIPIKSSVTGLDVLRYMLADGNYERSKTSELKSLREDLQSIFPLFNVCSSLLLLGKVPKNIKEELRDVVTELGNAAVPFFKGKQRKIILTCLEHFGSGRAKRETERRVRDLDARLEENIPYVKSCLRFGRPDENLLDGQIDVLNALWENKGLGGRGLQEVDYSQCSNFSINDSMTSPSNLREVCSLTHLQTVLQNPEHMEDFKRELKKNPIPLQFDVKLTDNDGQEPVLAKVLHEVRVYIHLCLTDQLEKHSQVGRIKENMMRLDNLEKEVTRVIYTDAVVKRISEIFIRDLKGIQKSHFHCNNQNFCEELGQLWEKWQKIQIVKYGNDKEIQVPEREDKKVQMPECEDKEIQVHFPHKDKNIQVQCEDEEIRVQYDNKEIQVQCEDEETEVYESVV